MVTAEKINLVCFPLFLANLILAVMLAMIRIWLSIENAFADKLLLSAVVFVVSTGLTMSVSRALIISRARDARQ